MFSNAKIVDNQLLKSRKKEALKALFSRTAANAYKRLDRKQIWLISDRLKESDDNGKALFEYLCDHRELMIKPVFVASKKSPQYRELKKMGKVVEPFSIRHKLNYLAAAVNISSQAEDYVINPFESRKEYYKDIISKKPFVFLQHGITKDDLSDWLKRPFKNIRGFVTSGMAEYHSILDGAYDYDASRVWLTGFPRYDKLYHDEKKKILIMPTWRKSLTINKNNRGREAIPEFFESSYFQFFNDLLSSKDLLQACEQYGYSLFFVPHPNVRPYIDKFYHADHVQFAETGDSYRDIFAQGNLLITDYSSVAFDFAYLHKPVIYSQFDEAEFFDGMQVYKRGYFDYRRDGFGEVETDLNGTVNRVIEYMKRDCQLKEQYRQRIDAFFAYNDTDNCKRVTEKIRELVCQSC